MSLHVIVDGYNFLNAQPQLAALLARDLEAARHRLLAELARYRQRKGHQVSAVFDARRARQLPPVASRQGTRAGVGFVFSRPGQEADEVICEMARRAGMRAVVVTADGALAESCRRFGAAIVGPAEFAALLAEEDTAKMEEEEGEEAGSPKKGPAKRAPKRERRERLRKQKL